MANPVKGEAGFKTEAGPTLTLRFDFEALVSAEDAADKPLLDVLAALGHETPRLGVIRALLFGALQHHQPGFTLEQAGALVLSDTEKATQALFKAISSAFPQTKGARGGGSRPPRQSPGTGTPSSRAGAKKA